jgi:hypothetical protein
LLVVSPGTAVRVKWGVAIAVLALLVCAPSAAQTPTPDPAPLPPAPPPPSEPPPPASAEAPPATTVGERKDRRPRRHHAKERGPTLQLGPLHGPIAELGPAKFVPRPDAVAAGRVISVIPENDPIDRTDSPRPIIIAVAVALVLMAGGMLLVSFQH